MTKEEAVALYDSKFWEELPLDVRVRFQIIQDRLCMPFEIFQKAVEKTLGRPVFTHEFGLNRDGLIKELFLGAEPPSMVEVLDMIPADKRILVVTE